MPRASLSAKKMMKKDTPLGLGWGNRPEACQGRLFALAEAACSGAARGAACGARCVGGQAALASKAAVGLHAAIGRCKASLGALGDARDAGVGCWGAQSRTAQLVAQKGNGEIDLEPALRVVAQAAALVLAGRSKAAVVIFGAVAQGHGHARQASLQGPDAHTVLVAALAILLALLEVDNL